MGNCNCGCEHEHHHGPTIEGLGHISLFTKDIEKTVDFYTNILGFQKIEEIRKETEEGTLIVVFLLCVDIIIEAIQQPGGKCEGVGDGCFQHLAIQVTGIEELIEILREDGVVFETEMEVLPHMFNGSKIIFFRGPSGERLELFEYGDIGGCEGDCCDCENSDCCGGSDDEECGCGCSCGCDCEK
ncbi:MAG: VOC family protein [Clostridia bacterium]|nr:VOC family protein [Clostridia bacterium]